MDYKIDTVFFSKHNAMEISRLALSSGLLPLHQVNKNKLFDQFGCVVLINKFKTITIVFQQFFFDFNLDLFRKNSKYAV